MAKNRKRKFSDTVKAQRKQAKYSRVRMLLKSQQMYHLAKVKVTESQAEAISLETTGQGSNDDSLYKWLVERKYRITASHTGSIGRRRATTKMTSAVKQLYTKFTGNTATRWGNLQEE